MQTQSFNIMQQYLKREMQNKPVTNKEIAKAKALINKVTLANGTTLPEKARAADVDYAEFMKAQRIVYKK